MAKPAKPVQTYVTESMIRETVDKFNRLIKTLGINNTSGIAWVDVELGVLLAPVLCLLPDDVDERTHKALETRRVFHWASVA